MSVECPCSSPWRSLPVSLFQMMYESRVMQRLARFPTIVNGGVPLGETPLSALISRSIFHTGDRG
jgi:hypothetical protein